MATVQVRLQRRDPILFVQEAFCPLCMERVTPIYKDDGAPVRMSLALGGVAGFSFSAAFIEWSHIDNSPLCEPEG